jgi:hypothetical protein
VREKKNGDKYYNVFLMFFFFDLMQRLQDPF